mgnify:CR=1 FL=1
MNIKRRFVHHKNHSKLVIELVCKVMPITTPLTIIQMTTFSYKGTPMTSNVNDNKHYSDYQRGSKNGCFIVHDEAKFDQWGQINVSSFM